MARSLMSFRFALLVLVLINIVVNVVNARPLNPNPVKVDTDANADVGSVFEGLALGSMKLSGGFSPGAQHKFTVSSQTLGGIKDSGPSPGVGHSYATDTKN
ncbi:hypothetical protein AgCh_012587 [Apium graveolens]